jgi:secondary thiamine-phosphate synthase enzyme
METINLTTNKRNQFIEITNNINRLLELKNWKDGIIVVFTPHTTAAVTINENADPDVQIDMQGFLSKLIPDLPDFKHMEGNSDSHIKPSLVGASETIIVENGRMQLGTWQGVYFCEFDGGRNRQVYLKFIKSE